MDTEGSFPCSHQPVVSLVHFLLYNTSVADAFCTSCSVFQVSSGVLRALEPSGHYMYRTVVTICTASGHYMYRQIQHSTIPRSALGVYLCVLCGSQNKNRLFLVCITEMKSVFAAR
jgi:hypothetical protein